MTPTEAQSRLAELLKLRDAATPGPWLKDGEWILGSDSPHVNGRMRSPVTGISSASFSDRVCEIYGCSLETTDELMPVVPRANAAFIATIHELATIAEALSAEVTRGRVDALRYRWLRRLKSGRPESQIALARVVIALRELPDKMDFFIDSEIAKDATRPPEQSA